MATMSTDSAEYSSRLKKVQRAWWKRLLPVQLPYMLNLRSLRPGFMLVIGCGLGRDLQHNGGRGVGIDHNADFVADCVSRGLIAYTPDTFMQSSHAKPETFDSIVVSHVLEHMTLDACRTLLASYLPFLKQAGSILIMTPQEVGFRSDPSHVEFVDFRAVQRLAKDLGLQVKAQYSFPFPRAIGHLFIYNEFVSRLTR